MPTYCIRCDEPFEEDEAFSEGDEDHASPLCPCCEEEDMADGSGDDDK